MTRSILAIAAVLGFAAFGSSDDKKPERPKAEPAGTPLEITITGKTTKYTLDTGGRSAADYKSMIDAATGKGAKLGGRLPAAPGVDLALEIKNTSDKTVQVWQKGDPVVLTLELKGKGAVNALNRGPMTLEFRLPSAVEIEAGKTFTMPIKSLSSGMRGVGHVAYWTEPGEYELVAKLQTGMSPAPKGAKEGMDGFGMVVVISPALKITVEAKK